MKEIFKAIDDAYFLLDKCIDKLLKGRITKDEKLEQEAHYDMERAVNGAMQNLSYLEGRLKGKTLNDWIKVEDRLPEKDKWVLVYYKAGVVGIGILGIDGWISDNDEEIAVPDYWQEIIPPKED